MTTKAEPELISHSHKTSPVRSVEGMQAKEDEAAGREDPCCDRPAEPGPSQKGSRKECFIAPLLFRTRSASLFCLGPRVG